MRFANIFVGRPREVRAEIGGPLHPLPDRGRHQVGLAVAASVISCQLSLNIGGTVKGSVVRGPGVARRRDSACTSGWEADQRPQVGDRRVEQAVSCGSGSAGSSARSSRWQPMMRQSDRRTWSEEARAGPRPTATEQVAPLGQGDPGRLIAASCLEEHVDPEIGAWTRHRPYKGPAPRIASRRFGSPNRRPRRCNPQMLAVEKNLPQEVRAGREFLLPDRDRVTPKILEPAVHLEPRFRAPSVSSKLSPFIGCGSDETDAGGPGMSSTCERGQGRPP